MLFRSVSLSVCVCVSVCVYVSLCGVFLSPPLPLCVWIGMVLSSSLLESLVSLVTFPLVRSVCVCVCVCVCELLYGSTSILSMPRCAFTFYKSFSRCLTPVVVALCFEAQRVF